MANIVDIQTLVDGPRNLVVKVYLESDGAAGELSNQVIVDASALNPVPETLHLTGISYDLNGFNAKLMWDATTNDELLNISGNQDYCFRGFGGIKNPKSTGSTGDVLISTNGFSATSDKGFILMEFTKH